jgi:hypothetical protein
MGGIMIHHYAEYLDLIKVNGLTGFVVVMSNADFIALNKALQETGNTILVALAIAYSIMKIVKIMKDKTAGESNGK